MFTPNGDGLMIAKLLSRLCDVKSSIGIRCGIYALQPQVWNTKSGPWALTLGVFKIAGLWGFACGDIHLCFSHQNVLQEQLHSYQMPLWLCDTDLNGRPCFRVLLSQQVYFRRSYFCSGNECFLDELRTEVHFPSRDHIGFWSYPFCFKRLIWLMRIATD